MKKIVWALCILIVPVAACKTKKNDTQKKYGDFFNFNLKGNILSIQDSIFVADSTGRVQPDSLCYGFGEYEDNHLIKSTDIDTNGKKIYNTYSHFDNGLWKGMESVLNGKTIYKLNIQLDSAEHYNTAQSYDSAGKMDYYNTDLEMNEYGMLTAGKLYKADSSLVNSFTGTYDKNIYTGGSSFDSSGKLISKTTVKSNEHGDQVEETIVTMGKDSNTTTITRYSYIYDETSNWTQQTKMDEKGKPVKITKRVITYAKKED
jgi:hypothetical protein